MKRLLSLIAPVVAVAALAAGCGAVTPYAATVNGERISQRDLDRELRAIRDNEAYLGALEQGQFKVKGSNEAAKDTFDAAFVARVLTRRILLELVHQEVEKKGLTLSEADNAFAKEDVLSGFDQDPQMFERFDDAYQDELIQRTAEVNALQAELAGVKLDAASVAAYYDQHEDEFSETCVRHILIDNETPDPLGTATAIKARLAAGEDFAAIAQAESKDPGSGASGGALGCVAPNSFVPEFETVMNSLAPKQVSDPVQTQFGFHLIEVTERRPRSLDQVEGEIRRTLLETGQDPFNAFLRTSIDKAKVTVNPRYGRFQVTEEGPQVIPPQAPTTTTSAVVSPEEVPFTPPAGSQGGASTAPAGEPPGEVPADAVPDDGGATTASSVPGQ